MLSDKFALGALSLFVVASAAPAALESKSAPTVTVCIDSINPPNGCVTIPFSSDSCITFTGGLSAWNKQVSNAQIPEGFICTFFETTNCVENGDAGQVSLPPGTQDFFTAGFNDQASSFLCSAL
ncbi:hypothetical protein BDQ12DRAFT_726061 [Crucibulum laeve]|uniref:Uncharacterized protein n=1 Tax=Crucibulum laeve TaxID=68775 RepID=A0A5C3LR16_9AGAR|nr:hypothetical protein BDQ12DRAFT_726061 [Crucibulum laeve]